jgi:hypothetical protein
MKVATKGHQAEWFDMPPDVEKVAICRLSGARARPECKHQYVATTPEDAAVGTMGVMAAEYLTPVRELPPSEPPVYEELFPVGAISSALCHLHGPQPWYAGVNPGEGLATSDASSPSTASATPLVDAELRRSRVVVQRIVGTDGITRVVITQKKR